MSTTNNNLDSGNQVVCIKRSETSISNIFEDMYLNERLVDVTLSCSNGQLQAHKLVLAASSPYFSNLFDSLPSPFHYPVIVLKDMHIEDLRLIMEFIYKGQLTIDQERLIELIKCAENLQIAGLSDLDSSSLKSATTSNEMATIIVDVPRLTASSLKLSKRAKKSTLNSNQFIFERTYHSSLVKQHASPDKLLEQSMITGESPDNNCHQQFNNYANNHPTSTKNLSITSQHHHQHLNVPSSSLQLHSIEMDHQQQNHHQLSNQLQVLSHSLATNRSSLPQSGTILNGQSINGNTNHQSSLSQHRGRVHPCNICWKTFRERANLKRHLQVHSLDRTMYACLDCNKTFSWKDNYIRHTKTAHHMNNARQQA